MPENTILTSSENVLASVPEPDDAIIRDGNKHYPYTADFINDEDVEVRHTFHFRRPQRAHILRIAKASKDKGYDVQKEVLVELCPAEERQPLRTVLEEYPLLAVTYGDEVFKTAGAGSVFKGK